MKFQVLTLTAVLASVCAAQRLEIPTRSGNIISLPAPSIISGVKDFGNREYDRGRPCNSDKDTGSANAVFILQNGATLSNVIIGGHSLEGVHCEDAITIKGTGSVLIQGSGAQDAKDKVVQHNGRGTTTARDYTVVNVGKLFRSCGNCSKNGGPRNVVFQNVKTNRVNADLVGINSNYGDVATISGSCGIGIKEICQEFKGIIKNGKQELPQVGTTANCRGPQSKFIPAC